MPTPRLSIIIPTYNRPARLADCLKALAAQKADSADWEVIIVNDGGADVAYLLTSLPGHLQVRLLNQPNQGPATARNLGAKASNAALLAFLDDDCMPEPDWVVQILERVREGELAGGKVVNLLKQNIYSETCQTLIDYLYQRLSGTTDMFFTSNNLCIHAADFLRLGGFHTGFKTSAGEDRELCVRAAQSGIRLRWVPEIRIGHSHGMGMWSFIRLHVKYGRAANTYRHSVNRLEIAERTNGGHGFYLGLLLYPFQKKLQKPLFQCLLLGLSQACTIVGFAYERFLMVGSTHQGNP